MATYGYDQYGTATYGPSAPTGNYPGSQITIPVVNTAYILPGITAEAQDYGTILVSWGVLPTATMATVTEFRLLTNPWGFPVDQNDGTIVLDVTGAPPAPGTQYTDVSGTPGAVQYYGFYVLASGTWLRAGFTACLLPYYHGYDVKLLDDLPAFFQNQDLGTVATDIQVTAPNLPATGGSVNNPYSYDVDVWLSAQANVMVNGVPLGEQTFFSVPAGDLITISYSLGTTWQWISRAQPQANTALTDYLAIIGMGLDIVKSQYDMKFKSLNNPMKMSLGDLANFCAEIGLPYNPEIPAYTMRKAAAYWGQVMQKRATIPGIAEHITLLTGYPADIQVSQNMMLDNDQSAPEDPVYPTWNANTHYNVGEMVTFPVARPWSVVSTYNVGSVVLYNDLLYTCTVANTTEVPPTTVSNWSQNVSGPYLYYCLVANQNQQPSGSTSANTYWSCVYGGDRNGAEYTASLIISGIGSNAGTWEFLDAAGDNLGEAIGVGFPTPQTWTQSGSTPQTGPNGWSNTFRALNGTAGTLTNTWLRSVARSAADIAAAKIVPDPQLIVEHAVPVPSGILPWSSSTVYKTNALVTYGNLNYIALRQSTGATPPSPQAVLNQNYDFETSISPWVSDGVCTIAQSAAQAYHGTHSLAQSYTGANTSVHFGSEKIPVIPGATYVATALVFTASSGMSTNQAVNYYDAFNNYQSTASATATPLTASTWTALSLVFTAPSNVSQVQMVPSMTGTMTGGVTTYWDLVELTCVATPEWAPLGQDERLPITMSGYAIADLGFAPTVSATVTPFCEFYDNWGNLITRVFARGASGGAYPTNYQYDSFDTGAGYPLAGRVPQTPNTVWSVPVGDWTVSTNGIVYAGSSAADALGVVPSPAAGTVAATVMTAAPAGDDCGPLFWYSNTSNFWVAGLVELYYVASAVTRTVAYTGTAAVGDRIYVEFNNTTSTTNIPSGTLIGPSVYVYKNTRTSANTLVVVGSGGTATQTAMSSLTTPYLPSTAATTSNAGIASIVQ